MGITEFLVGYIVAFISSTGYFSVLLLMAMESMVLPVPSEAVMPFAGFLIVSGDFTFAGVILFSTVGSIIGSLISYWMGWYGGRPFIERYGKYLLLDKHHLALTEDYFNKRGEVTIFISRFIPIVRHLISIPAGMGKMNIWRFIVFTAIGAAIWNAFLTFVGIKLKENWNEILKYSSIIDIIVLAILAVVVLYVAHKLRKVYKKNKSSASI